MLSLFPSRFPAGQIVRSGRVSKMVIMRCIKPISPPRLTAISPTKTFITYFLNDPNLTLLLCAARLNKGKLHH